MIETPFKSDDDTLNIPRDISWEYSREFSQGHFPGIALENRTHSHNTTPEHKVESAIRLSRLSAPGVEIAC